MKTPTIIILVLITSFFSCTEQNEKSKIENILEKIERGDDIQSDLDDLLDYINNEEGTFEVSFSKANFKVKFPVTNVEEFSTKQIIDNKELEVFHYSANMQGKNHINLGYQLDYTFLPDIISKSEIDNLFKEQRDYILSATNSKLEFDKIIEKNNAPGRHLYLTIDESNLKANYKMYFKNGILYTLVVITEEGKLFNESISEFFDSFKITK